MNNKFELLAPAGSLTALKAAVQAGANAIYLAGSMFGARASAQNFTDDEIDDAVMYCHIRNVKVYVTVNTLVKDFEFKKLYDYIQFLYNADVDAVIVQDLGVLHFIKRHWPDFDVHASTQMSIRNQQGVEFAQENGISRIVIAREMETKEIADIVEKTGAEIEVFVHGALCFAYSGQCLMSSMLGGRSGNRGRCAQPCRKKYKLIDKESKKIIETKGDFLLSPKDLMTIEEIHTLLDTGVHSLKIEGRMRKPEYVSTVVKNYREAIDAYLDNRKYTLTDENHKNISAVFNRGFTKGHVLNKGAKDLINPLAPGHMGIKVGQVTHVDLGKRRVSVQLSEAIRAGDGIKIKSEHYETGMLLTQMWIKNQKMKEGHKNDLVELPLTGKVQRGAIVYKTSDKQLAMLTEDGIRKSELKFPIEMELNLELNEPMELFIKDDRGSQVRVVSEVCPEKALKVALSEERVELQLKKLGDDPYYINDLKINLGNDLALPIKELNALRRDAIEELNLIRCNLNQRVYNESPMKVMKQVHREDVVATKLNVKVQDMEQLECLKGFDIDTVYFENLNSFEEALLFCEENGFKCVPTPGRIQTSLENMNCRDKMNALNMNEILESNVGHFSLSNSSSIYVDYFLNTFNKETFAFYKSKGIQRVTPSLELSEKELKKIIANTDLEIELLGYGYIPLMITENCPIKGNVTSEKGCEWCAGRSYVLEDEKGYPFPTQCIGGRLVIYNGTALDMYNRVENLVKLNADFIRLDFTMESPSEIKNIVSSFINALDQGNILNDPSRKQTYGHYFRGVE